LGRWSLVFPLLSLSVQLLVNYKKLLSGQEFITWTSYYLEILLPQRLLYHDILVLLYDDDDDTNDDIDLSDMMILLLLLLMLMMMYSVLLRRLRTFFCQLSSSSSVLIQALGPYTDTHNTHTPKTRTIQNRR